MIITDNLRNSFVEDCDEIWAIVRSLRGPHCGLRQVMALAPSLPLFWKFQRLRDEGQWGEEAFEKIYKPQFLEEMKDPKSQAKLNELVELDRAGKTIKLVCFCNHKKLCHRSLVGELLAEKGCQVIFR